MIFTSEQPEEIKIYKGGFINQAGYYKGIINYAYDYIKPKGTAKNIVIDFVSNQGQSSLNYLNVSYFDKKGDEVENESNMKLIKAQLLPLLKIKKLESKKGIVSIRNKETKQNEDVEKMVYNQLADRNIGIWFKESIDENQINQKTGMPYVNYNIFAFFKHFINATVVFFVLNYLDWLSKPLFAITHKPQIVRMFFCNMAINHLYKRFTFRNSQFRSYRTCRTARKPTNCSHLIKFRSVPVIVLR
jgi:hypothetical protein